MPSMLEALKNLCLTRWLSPACFRPLFGVPRRTSDFTDSWHYRPCDYDLCESGTTSCTRVGEGDLAGRVRSCVPHGKVATTSRTARIEVVGRKAAVAETSRLVAEVVDPRSLQPQSRVSTLMALDTSQRSAHSGRAGDVRAAGMPRLPVLRLFLLRRRLAGRKLRLSHARRRRRGIALSRRCRGNQRS